MNSLITYQQLEIQILQDVRKYQISCFCSVHQGELITQVEAFLPNCKWVCIVLDHDGYHVMILDRKPEGDWWMYLQCPDGVSEETMMEMILDEL